MWLGRTFGTVSFTAVTAAFVLASSKSFAIAQDNCDLEDLLISIGEVEYVDNGREGPSAGDNRILLLHLHDESGEHVGHVNAISTVLHGFESDITTIHVEGTVHLEGGRFHWTNTQTLADPQDTTRSTNDEVHSVVLGGSGVFENVGGIMISRPEGDGGRLIFNLSC